MGSKTDAIISEPSRFFSYLSNEDKQFIFSGSTQAERIHRLETRFCAFFMGEDDRRGQHFIDDDLTGDSDFPKSLMRLYNCAEAREYREKHFPEEHMRKTTEEVREIIRAPRKPPVVAEQPKKIISMVRGYYSKAAKKQIKGYQRTIPQAWSKREIKFVLSRLQEKSVQKLTIAFNSHFGTQRTIRSVQTKRVRLARKGGK